MSIAKFLDCIVFGLLGMEDYGSLRYATKFDPFLSLDCAGVEGRGYNQILPSGNLVLDSEFFCILCCPLLLIPSCDAFPSWKILAICRARPRPRSLRSRERRRKHFALRRRPWSPRRKRNRRLARARGPVVSSAYKTVTG